MKEISNNLTQIRVNSKNNIRVNKNSDRIINEISNNNKIEIIRLMIDKRVKIIITEKFLRNNFKSKNQKSLGEVLKMSLINKSN